MQSIFREYDIRGIYQKELNFETITRLGYHLGEIARKFGEYVVIGYDARTHSPTLFEWLASGFNASGMRVLNIGLTPTPVNYFACNNEFGGITPILGVQITGSHNPPEYNGFKITLDKRPFYGEQIYALGKTIAQSSVKIELNPTSTKIEALDKYIEYMKKEFAALGALKTPVTIDCGNGAGGVALEPILKGLNIPFLGLYAEPDGTFPNHHPDPSEEETLEDIKHELSKRGGIGFAFDGDADRLAVLTTKNNIKGDTLATIMAKRMQNPVVIGEVKCSQVMYDEINKIGKAHMWKTGHSNLKVKVKELNATFAAEVSGHIFFNDRYFGYDDAIYSALRVLELVNEGVDLDAEVEKLPKMYNTEEIKVKTTEEKKFKIIVQMAEMLKNPPSDFPKIKEIITVDGLRVVFEHGFGLVRASNTTPILVTRFEGDTQENAKLYEEKLNIMIKEAESKL